MNIRVSISEQRFRPYLLAAGHDEQRALALCLWNIRLSEAFYPTIHATEVSLRNHVHGAIELVYGPTWWGAPAFRRDLDRGVGKLDEAVALACRKVARKARPLAAGDVVSELTLGFWTRMLDPRHGPAIWSRRFGSTFPEAPADVGVRQMKAELDHVLDLRNRIFHHEPIFRREVLRDHAKILRVLRWINPRKADWIGPHSRLPDVARQKPR